MPTDEQVMRRVLAALEIEPRVNLHRFPISVHYADGVLTLEGEVEHIVAKRRAVQRARMSPGVVRVWDQLRVRPAEAPGDATIRDHIERALMDEPAFAYHELKVWDKGRWDVRRESAEVPAGHIDLRVENGVVTLAGAVVSLSHKRLAGALAWWAAGACDVRNRLEISPPEEDNDDEVTDAVRLVLEKDPLVNAERIAVSTRGLVVTLRGGLSKAREKELAEYDAWYVEGVTDVDNQIVVIPA